MLRDKLVTGVNKNLEIYGAAWHKTLLCQFLLSNDNPVLTGERAWPYEITEIILTDISVSKI